MQNETVWKLLENRNKVVFVKLQLIMHNKIDVFFKSIQKSNEIGFEKYSKLSLVTTKKIHCIFVVAVVFEYHS